ncbi:MAG: hypothetical protein ABWY82_15355, partial [Tardiphaga sp.]
MTVRLDGNTKVDFSDVGSEKLTFVRVGEKLIVLFDNQSTVTVEPVFDSMGNPLSDIAFEMGPGRSLTGDQFASLFPITTDQSVLPAAGNGASSPVSGGNFSAPSVGGLGDPNAPLDLLGNEDTGSGFGSLQANGATSTPVAGGVAIASLDEDGFSEGNPGGLGDSVGSTTVTGSLNVNF